MYHTHVALLRVDYSQIVFNETYLLLTIHTFCMPVWLNSSDDYECQCCLVVYDQIKLMKSGNKIYFSRVSKSSDPTVDVRRSGTATLILFCFPCHLLTRYLHIIDSYMWLDLCSRYCQCVWFGSCVKDRFWEVKCFQDTRAQTQKPRSSCRSGLQTNSSESWGAAALKSSKKAALAFCILRLSLAAGQVTTGGVNRFSGY